MSRNAMYLLVAVGLSAAGFSSAFGLGADERARLNAVLQEAMEAEDWPAAVDSARRLVELSPSEAGPAYNLACVYARSGEKDLAVQWLVTAGERGFSFTSTMLNDEDLDSIRDHADYAKALQIIRANNAGELEKFKKKHGNEKVLTIVPPELDVSRAAPLIVALHGRGSNAADIVQSWKTVAAQAGAILIAPQAVLRRGTNGFDWGVVEQGEWLVLNAIERTKAAHNIDPKRIVLTGFSQGGAMTYLIGLRNREMFAGIIPVAGFYDHRVAAIPDPQNAADGGVQSAGEPTPARRSSIAASFPRVYIMYGALDEEVENNRMAAKRFEALGVPCTLKIYPGLGHALPNNRDLELSEALRFALDQ